MVFVASFFTSSSSSWFHVNWHFCLFLPSGVANMPQVIITNDHQAGVCAVQWEPLSCVSLQAGRETSVSKGKAHLIAPRHDF